MREWFAAIYCSRVLRLGAVGSAGWCGGDMLPHALVYGFFAFQNNRVAADPTAVDNCVSFLFLGASLDSFRWCCWSVGRGEGTVSLALRTSTVPTSHFARATLSRCWVRRQAALARPQGTVLSNLATDHHSHLSDQIRCGWGGEEAPNPVQIQQHALTLVIMLETGP